MIGGPLDAVIRAQAGGDDHGGFFIKQVRLNKTAWPMVAFRYRRPGQSGDQDVEHSLVVPLLTIVPVPFIRVDETVIDFKAKIVGVNRDQNARRPTTSRSPQKVRSVSPRSGRRASRLPTRISQAQRAAARERTTAERMQVRAVSGQMPAGLEQAGPGHREENSIKDKPSAGGARTATREAASAS